MTDEQSKPFDLYAKWQLLQWHAEYSALNGTEYRILALMISSAHVETGIFTGQLARLAERLDITQSHVSMMVGELVRIGIMGIGSQSPRGSYRIYAIEELERTFAKEVDNEQYTRAQTIFNKMATDDKSFASWEPFRVHCRECAECRPVSNRLDKISADHYTFFRHAEQSLDDFCGVGGKLFYHLLTNGPSSVLLKRLELQLIDMPLPRQIIIDVRGRYDSTGRKTKKFNRRTPEPKDDQDTA